ncbi:hypothetical protein D3C74_326530 [compost metagenome]
MQPVLIDLGFDIGVFLLLLGDKSAARIAELLFRAVLRRLNITRQAQQTLTQRFDIGLDQLQNTEALLGIEQPRHVEWTLFGMQEDTLQFFSETSGDFSGELLLGLDIFLTGTGKKVLFQLRIHIHHLVFDDIAVVQALAVLIAGQRLRHTGLEGFDHAVEIDAQLARQLLHILLPRCLLEHFVHLVEQAECQIRRHFLNRQHRRRSADDVVFIIGRIRLVHLRNVRADVADIVVDREFLARLLFLAGHEVRNILRRHVHAVVIGILQQLAFSIGRRDQMAQVERRQR